jgi:hypothetical protein
VCTVSITFVEIKINRMLSMGHVVRVSEACSFESIKKLNSMALVRERTIPTERPPPVGES